MYVENKIVSYHGNSTVVSVKPNAGPMLQRGEEIKVEYHKDKIVIRRLKWEKKSKQH